MFSSISSSTISLPSIFLSTARLPSSASDIYSELAFIANRKNTDQHIVLFGWSSDKNNGAAMIEISNDAWLPTINLQGPK